MRTKTPSSVGEVVTAGLCTGCGLCASIAGPAISMGLNIDGNMRPLVRRPIPPRENAQIMEACPGISLTGPGLPGGAEVHALWGPIREAHRSWSADPVVRHKAAAGGTLSTLGRFLLSSGRVEAILHVRADERKPWLTRSTISTTPEEVLEASQSRYGPSSPLTLLHSLLDSGKRFAVVAKPCDISAVRALGRADKRVALQIPYMLTNFCGGVHREQIAKAVMRHHGVDEQDVVLYRYRGEGWPGPLRVQTRNGTAYDLPYPGGWRMGQFSYELQFRCKVCPDSIGEVADISAPDGWILRDGKPLHDEAPGTNLSIARTPAGQELLRAAVDAGALIIAPVTIQEIEQMHRNHHRKAAAPAVLAALRLMGQPSLKLSGYRTRDALRRAGLRDIAKQILGTVRRVRAGENKEHVI